MTARQKQIKEKTTNMKLIDSKYAIEMHMGEQLIVKAATGEPIPDDEPLILFRADGWE